MSDAGHVVESCKGQLCAAPVSPYLWQAECMLLSTLLLVVSPVLVQAQASPTDYQRGVSLLKSDDAQAALRAFKLASAQPRFAVPASVGAARACARLGQVDAAFGWLGKAVAGGWGQRQVLASDVDLQRLAKDPRFAVVIPPLREGADAFLEPTRVLHSWDGEAGGDQYGWVARRMGDLDGDGAIDFASTAPTWNGSRGAVYVISSRTGKLLFRYDGKVPGMQVGNAVSGEVDVNGDGLCDVIVGAPGFGTQAGKAIVLSGKDGAVLHELTRGVPSDQYGMKVSGIEDLNGDGLAEIAVGAAGDGAGRVLVHSGKDGSVLFEIEGEVAGDQFGTSLDGTTAGGHRMLVVGAPKAGEARTGRAYVYQCTAEAAERHFLIETDKTGSNLGQYFVTWLGDVNGDGVPDAYASDWGNSCKGPGTGRVFVHSGADGSRLLTISGHQAGEGFGTTAAVCGDANGDGSADMIIGAWQHGAVAKSAGACYLHSGKDGSLLHQWSATQGGDTLGFDAVGLGDVDGDGGHDFLLTSAWSTVQNGRQGRVFLVAGPVYPAQAHK